MKKSRILTIIALVLVAMLSFTACDAIKDLITPPTPDVQSHVCESVCPECGHCLDAECTDAACATKCQGHKTPDETPAHECESVCAECGKCTDADCTESACAEKCEGHEVAPAHKCESVCEECGKCTDADCSESVCAEKCEGHVAATTPVISVVPEELEINAGEEIDLMFGVSVSDEGDENARVIIDDDDGFDANVEGVYTITYLAMNKFGVQVTATRKVTVLKALSALSLEVQKNILGEQKWTGNLLNFQNAEYVELNDSKTYDYAVSGVFHNNTSSEITLNVGGGYGVAAIITANGVVIEGRDGANGLLMNQSNPTRAGSSAKVDVNKFAENMVIPAGGYAIVVQSGYAGSGVDADGRGFMNWNVIGTYGNVVRLVWVDTAEVLTPYVDQAPVISGYNTTVYAGNSEFALDTEVIAGVTATDDNGTFDPSDDVTVTVIVKDNGGFDIEKQGKYNITLEATDGTNTTTVTRVVEVTTSSVEIKINNNSYTTLEDLIAVDKDLTVLGKYLFIIYTPDYTGTLNWTNGYGVAVVINQYGEIVRVYDGASAKYFDAANPSGVQDGTCTAAGYLKEAFDSRQAGEYVLVAPNGNGNVSRSFLYSNRTVGAKVTLPGITFKAHECESKCAKCGGCLDADCAEAACVTKCSCHKCESVCDNCGKCTDATCTEEVCASKCEGHDVPAHACEHVCEHCAKCTDTACTEEVCASKCQGHDKSMFVTIGTSKKYEAVDGMWAINETITTATAANKAVWVFTKDYTGEFTTNGYGVAVVLDKYGRITEVYDGANGGYWLPSGKQDSAHFNVNTYATVAWSELEEGEYLVVFPNGADGNKARQIGLDSRYLFNQKMNITGITFEIPHECESKCDTCGGCLDAACEEAACAKKCGCFTVSIGSKIYVATEGMWAINETITTATAANKAVWVFTKDYTGEFTTNGYGVAVVLDKYGRITEVYDGANGGYWLPSGKQDSAHFNVNTYATVAWSELEEGEYLVVFPNGADSNKARQIGLDCRYLFNQVLNLTGITYADPNMTITIGSKTYTATEGKWLYNTEVTANTAANYAIVIYDKNYTGTFATNGWGVAVVLTAEGKVSRIYDGANAGYTDKDSGVNNKDYGVTTSNFATLAWESLQEGETLVILPNGGSDGNAARQVGLDCRWLIGQKMSITGFTFN